MKNKVAHSTGVICSLFSRELVYWGTVAEGENGISSLLIMDHNQLQDYRENCVLIESQQMYVNCFPAFFFLFLFFWGGWGEIKQSKATLKLERVFSLEFFPPLIYESNRAPHCLFHSLKHFLAS